MEDAKASIREALTRIKAFVAQEAPPRLSEADTKANFIEPIISVLGWIGIGVVTREYYVRNSQEFIDYVMSGPRAPILAVEAKPLQSDLTDKNAAQLIQYCSVEGIEWAALTNARELQFFNTFLKPDLTAKRILRLDLLAFNNDAEFDTLFDQVWQLSRERMTDPSGVRTWLHQRRLDAALRGILLNPGSSTLRSIRKDLAAAEIKATPQDVMQWVRRHLTVDEVPQHIAPSATRGQTAEPRLALVPTSPARPERDPGSLIAGETSASPKSSAAKRYHGVHLRDLLNAELLPAGTPLTLVAKGQRTAATATLNSSGEIVWRGQAFRSPSDKTFAPLLGVTSFNGWDYWQAELPNGRVSLAELRERFQARQDGDVNKEARA